MRILAYSLIVLLLPAFAQAELKTRNDTVQRGVFYTDGCVHEKTDFANSCKCKSDVRRLVITGGLPKDVKSRVNALLAKESGAVPKKPTEGDMDFCFGTLSHAKPEENTTVIERNTGVTYQDADVLTFSSNWYWYGAGAAHGNYGNSTLMVNAKTGEVFDVLKVASEKQIKALNAFIAHTLRTQYADDLMDDELKRTTPYVTSEGCEGCNIYYSGNGWEVEFQLYTVAPYSSGMITVIVPESVLPSPHTMIAGK